MTYEEYSKLSKDDARKLLNGFDEKEVEEYLASEGVEKILQDNWMTHNGKVNSVGDCIALMF